MLPVGPGAADVTLTAKVSAEPPAITAAAWGEVILSVAATSPVPINCTVLALVTVLSLKTRFAKRLPVAAGVKMMPTVQVWPPSRTDPAVSKQLVVLGSTLKSPGFVPVKTALVICSSALPVLDTVSTWAVLLEPVVTPPSAR